MLANLILAKVASATLASVNIVVATLAKVNSGLETLTQAESVYTKFIFALFSLATLGFSTFQW